MKIRWSELAELRVAEAYSVIAQDRPEAAERWFTRVLTWLDLLVTHPESGRIVPEAGWADIREVLVRPYRIMYRVDPNRVLVLTLRHSRRSFDPQEVLEE